MGEREQHTQNPNSALPGVLICIPDSACAALRSMRSPVHGCSAVHATYDVHLSFCRPSQVFSLLKGEMVF